MNQIANLCKTDHLGRGDIVRMHVALPVLKDYLAHGYQLVTMEELIQP